VAMGHSALQAADVRAWETARTLGAAPLRALYTVLREVRFALLAALMAAYGRIIAEVGASLLYPKAWVGGFYWVYPAH